MHKNCQIGLSIKCAAGNRSTGEVKERIVQDIHVPVEHRGPPAHVINQTPPKPSQVIPVGMETTVHADLPDLLPLPKPLNQAVLNAHLYPNNSRE